MFCKLIQKKIVFISLIFIFGFWFLVFGFETAFAVTLLGGLSCVTDGSCTVEQMMGVIGKAAQFLLGIVGSVTLLLFIYGGFVWLTSGGKPDRIEKGKTIIIQTVIGLAIVFGAYVGINFLVKALGAEIPVGTKTGSGARGEDCVSKHPDWLCTNINNRPQKEEGCEAGLCPGPANIMCCGPVTDEAGVEMLCDCKCLIQQDVPVWHETDPVPGVESELNAKCRANCVDYVVDMMGLTEDKLLRSSHSDCQIIQ